MCPGNVPGMSESRVGNQYSLLLWLVENAGLGLVGTSSWTVATELWKPPQISQSKVRGMNFSCSHAMKNLFHPSKLCVYLVILLSVGLCLFCPLCSWTVEDVISAPSQGIGHPHLSLAHLCQGGHKVILFSLLVPNNVCGMMDCINNFFRSHFCL